MKTFTALILPLAFLISCGKASDSSDPASTAATSPVGVWKSGCLASSTAGWYQVATMSFTDSSTIVQSDQYFDTTCTTLRITDKETRSYKLGSSLANGAMEINYTIARIERTYKNQTNVESANAAKGFGYSDWTINVAKETNGLRYSASYPVMAKNGDPLFLIFKIDGTTYYGADVATGDGSSAAKRPTSVSTLTLKKQ